MNDPTWLNLMSICLGLAALVLPVVGGVLLARRGKRWHWCVAVSLAACATSLYGQIAYTRYLVEMEDFSVLMDTQAAVQRSALVLLLAVLMVNGVTAAILETRTKTANKQKSTKL